MAYYETPLYSVLHNKCPRCHQGDFFKNGNPYNLKQFDKMNTRCTMCNESFERETGFYYGAMYASYGITVGFGIVLFLLTCVVFKIDVIAYLIVFAILQILLMPYFYRISRLIWINVFVRYKAVEKK